MCIQLCELTPYRCEEIVAEQGVAKATLFTVLAASDFIIFFLPHYKCARAPMGVSSMSRVKAVNKLGQSDRELSGG